MFNLLVVAVEKSLSLLHVRALSRTIRIKIGLSSLLRPGTSTSAAAGKYVERSDSSLLRPGTTASAAAGRRVWATRAANLISSLLRPGTRSTARCAAGARGTTSTRGTATARCSTTTAHGARL